MRTLVRIWTIGLCATAVACGGGPISPDAGIPDAGVPDAGDLDAGDLDAGTTDGGDLDAGTTDGGVVTGSFVQDGAARLTASLCAFAARCRFVASEGSCLANPALLPPDFGSPAGIVDGALRGEIVIDDAAADRCIEDVRVLPCTATRTSPIQIAQCETAFRGVVQVGGRCATDLACASGAQCLASFVGGSCIGVCDVVGPSQCVRDADCPTTHACIAGGCQPRSIGAGTLGEQCGSLTPCNPGLACVQSSPTIFRCEEAPGIGGPCSIRGGDPCGTGFVCAVGTNVALGPQFGTCVPARGLGETCVTPFECGGFFSNLICNGGICVNRPTTGPCFFFGPFDVCDPAFAFCDGTVSPPQCRPRTAGTVGCFSDLDCGAASGRRCIGGACLADSGACGP